MGGRIGKKVCSGVGQLTLIEHALCPIDSQSSPHQPLSHETAFSYTDSERKRRTARVRVLCPLGLSPGDEFFLWGLLALTLADKNSCGELHATRHYLLRRLGVIDANARRGGRQYRRLSEAIDRIAAIQYFSDGFYDPIRGEHVRINFKFFSYAMPTDLASSRAWRIVWDPVFFQFASAARGAMWFDLQIYRQLSLASRRLYLFARKLLGRRGADITHGIDVRQLVTDVLGYSPQLQPNQQNARLRAALTQLIGFKLLRPGETRTYKRCKGQYSVVLARGPALHRNINCGELESPLLEPLCGIGFETGDARRLLSQFPTPLVRQWIDITLAKIERMGMGSFSKSPAAYLRYNLNLAASGTGSPPDWWHEVRKEEENRRATQSRKRREYQSGVPKKAIESVDAVCGDVFGQFLSVGQPESRAEANARRFADAVARGQRKGT